MNRTKSAVLTSTRKSNYRRVCLGVGSLCCLIPAYFGSLSLAQTAKPSAKPDETAALFKLVGFATINAYGVGQTTGGSGPVVEVRTAEEFRDALERSENKKKSDQDNTPRIVKVVGDIDLAELANERPGNEIKSVGKVEIRSNTTLFSAGEGATIRHGILDVHGAHNVIIRNLKFRDLWEYDPTGKYDRFGWDYVRLTSSGKTATHHVWIDHCDFGKCYDGQIDITHGSDLVTVSWCHLAGDERGPHKKSMLIGHSSSETARAMDQGRLNVTLHHNWFENIDDRAPRVRFGNIHVFNDFVDGASNATISVMHAVTLVENCVYKDTRIATTFSHAADRTEKEHDGTICIVNSRNIEPRAAITNATTNEKFEMENNFKGNVEREKLEFNAPKDWKWENRNVLPYPYRPDPVDSVPDLVKRQAGTGKVSDAELTHAQP